jgi:hypothetical protein
MDNTMRKNVEEMFFWKTLDVKIEREEESARIWEMGRDPEHVEMHGPSASENGGGCGRKPGCSLSGGEGSGQHPAKDRASIQRRWNIWLTFRSGQLRNCTRGIFPLSTG